MKQIFSQGLFPRLGKSQFISPREVRFLSTCHTVTECAQGDQSYTDTLPVYYQYHVNVLSVPQFENKTTPTAPISIACVCCLVNFFPPTEYPPTLASPRILVKEDFYTLPPLPEARELLSLLVLLPPPLLRLSTPAHHRSRTIRK